jgi:hypothetical protein
VVNSASLFRFERLEPAVRGYLNSGITFSANRRMFFSAISHGKLK